MKNHINFVAGNGNLPSLKVETPGSNAEIYLHGAHVTRFQRKSEQPLLWMSAKSRFDYKSPIRGGIPVIFPWFGPKEGAAAHGFARVKDWTLTDIATSENGAVSVKFRLPEVAEAAAFPPFDLSYTVIIGENLELQLATTNISADKVFAFEECLHTYFAISDISAISVSGLKGVTYLDKVGGTTERHETNDIIRVSSEVDRVYQDTTHTIEIRDEKWRRKIVIEKENSSSTVVWNPWMAKSKAMPDFGDEEYHGMICVESGNVDKNKITLAPGKTSILKVRLSAAAI